MTATHTAPAAFLPAVTNRFARTTGRFTLLIGGLVAVRVGGGAAEGALGLPGIPELLVDIALAVVLLLTYRLLARRVEGRSATELATPRAGRELSAGLLIGGGLFAGTAAILALLGTFHTVAAAAPGAVWAGVGSAILAGVFEELLIRGIVFRAIERKTGSMAALAISSVIFGALHLANPGATLLSALSISLETGALLGGAYLLTQRLWLPIGVHIAWNATEGAIFGSPTSGETSNGLFHSYLTGGHALSGGPFGVEGSAMTIVTCLAVGSVFLALRHREMAATDADAVVS